ncbi:MAG: hypothetical protein WA672_15405, partial [Candidatus Angelobacter sp.]
MKNRSIILLGTKVILFCAIAVFSSVVLNAQTLAADPGVITPATTSSPCGSGQPNPLPGLTTGEV